jgi:ferredoxin
MTIRVNVDAKRCFGFGRCVDMVPEVFYLGKDGKSLARNAIGVDRDQLEMAAWSCPMQAITLADDDVELDRATVDVVTETVS